MTGNRVKVQCNETLANGCSVIGKKGGGAEKVKEQHAEVGGENKKKSPGLGFWFFFSFFKSLHQSSNPLHSHAASRFHLPRTLCGLRSP